MTVFYVTWGKAEAIRSANRLCFPLKQQTSPCHSERQQGIPLSYIDILFKFQYNYYLSQILIKKYNKILPYTGFVVFIKTREF
jgi:hypothetical protein